MNPNKPLIPSYVRPRKLMAGTWKWRPGGKGDSDWKSSFCGSLWVFGGCKSAVGNFRCWCESRIFSEVLPSLQLTASSPLKIEKGHKRKCHLPTIDFQESGFQGGELVKTTTFPNHPISNEDRWYLCRSESPIQWNHGIGTWAFG